MTAPTESDELAFAIRDVSELRVGITPKLNLVLDAARRELARLRVRESRAAMTPVYSYLVLAGWHGVSATKVLTVGETPRRFRIRAIARTKLAGRDRWLEPGQETLVPKHAVRHGEWSKPHV